MKLAKFLHLLRFIGAWLFTVIFSACYYSQNTAKKLFEASRNTQYDVIIVPGVPFENGSWSRTMKGRIYWSKYLYDRGIAKNIMYSGGAVYTPYYESMIMAMYGAALGIPEKNIFYEIHAEHSTENIYYAYHQAKKLGFNKIALASDQFQTRALRRFTRRKVSPEIVMLPMVSDTMRMLQPAMIDPVIESDKANKPGFISIKKREGIFKRLMGTLGYNIKLVNPQ